MNPRLPLLLALLAVAGCAPRPPAMPPPDDLALLAARLTGHFSSAAQAARDSSFFDIRLRIVPIWPDVPGGPWLYVEQAAAAALARPYRQRVYRLERRADGALLSHVYELPGDPMPHAGAWNSPAPLATIRPDQLVARTGCTVILRRQPDGRLVGATDGQACLSTLRGATYATSEVALDADGMTTWDRGFNAAGTQVWGATQGGYRFDRVQ